LSIHVVNPQENVMMLKGTQQSKIQTWRYQTLKHLSYLTVSSWQKRLHHRPKTFKSPKPVFEGLAEGQNFLGASHTKPTSHIIPTNDAKNA
jgi:hypothetical protein